MPDIKLRLEEMYLGSIDAKHELLTNSEEEKERFSQSFVIPENLNPNSFLNGQHYFVLGLKGTGKTALLRYLAAQTEKDSGNHASFILFKSDLSEEDRSNFSKAANGKTDTIIVDKSMPKYEDSDYETVWRWFLHRHIVENIKKHNLRVFDKDYAWDQYVKCVESPRLGEENYGIKKLLPKLKRGNVEISYDPKLGIEFEWENAEKNLVKFGNLTKQADNLFKKLAPSRSKLYLFIDEVELSLGTRQQMNRDSLMVRDLIITIGKLNAISKEKKFGIYICSAIRSEVLTAVNILGKEVNKITGDFGLTITWDPNGGASINHPLLQIPIKRIISSESRYPGGSGLSAEIAWEKYFPKKIAGKPSDQYILQATWYRPRDIVRLLKQAQDQYPKETTFSEKVMTAIRSTYAQASWLELTEELRVKYSPDEIAGIKKLLIGLDEEFSYNQTLTKADVKKSMNPDIERLLYNHQIGDILSDLFRVGVLSNVIRRGQWEVFFRASYRGDTDLLTDYPMKIHGALKRIFTI